MSHDFSLLSANSWQRNTRRQRLASLVGVHRRRFARGVAILHEGAALDGGFDTAVDNQSLHVVIVVAPPATAWGAAARDVTLKEDDQDR